MADRKVDAEEVSKHNTTEDLWIIIDGKVWMISFEITLIIVEYPHGKEFRMRQPLLKVIFGALNSGFHDRY